MTTEIQAYPTADEIEAQLLSDLRYGYARLGVTVNTRKWSELQVRCHAVAQRISIAIQNGRISRDNVNPLTATGQPLLDYAAIFGVTPRPASASVGYVTCRVLSPATTVSIPADFVCTAADGVKYATTSSQVVAHLGTVRVQASVAGADGDRAAGELVTWDSAAIGYLDQKATIAAGGLDGGADADDEEAVRARLLRRLRFPGVGGNWSQVAEWAEASSAAIDFCAVYPAARGPSSYDIAVMGGVDDPSLTAVVTNAAAAAVVAEMPGSAHLNATSVVEQLLDVIVDLNVPLPVHAGGAGNGWIDDSPWPSTAETGANTYAEVTVTTPSAKTITVNSTNTDTPVAGKRFALWDWANQDTDGNPDPVFREFTILSVGGGSGAYVLTLDAPTSGDMAFITTGMFCSAAAFNLQTYGDLFRDAVALLGPGEKSDNADILQWARRKPSPDLERPYTLTSRQLSAVSDERSEVSDIAFAARLETGTGAAGTGTFVTRTTPAVPSTTANAPRLLTVKHLAFRRIV